MFPDDQTYKSFLTWLQDYARVVRDEYSSPGDLPLDNWYPTNQVLRLSDAPENWPTLTGVQLFVHAWNGDKAAWEQEPIAFTQGPVTPRHMVFGTLFLIAAKGKRRNSIPKRPRCRLENTWSKLMSICSTA